jgi:BirA family biotin operon repressor/biotin-[acetyl-CoA-carboxylase] ligase
MAPAARNAAALTIHSPGYIVAGVLLDTVDSTNSAALRMLRAGQLQDGDYVLAREQTAGRGTHGRTWASPRDAGIYLSVVCTGAAETLPLTADYTLASGLAVTEVLRERTNLDIRLKPVNDLYVGGRKLGGILVEGAADDTCLTALVIGVGINVRCAPTHLPPHAVPATALADELPASVATQSLSDSLVPPLVERIIYWTNRVRSGETTALRLACERLRP